MEQPYIHHECVGIGKKFTFDQWGEYLRQHKQSETEIVYSYNGFNYNVYDVCINYNIEELNIPNTIVKIKTANTPHGWVFGHSYQVFGENSIGGCSPCYLKLSKNDETFTTEREAKVACLKTLAEHLQKDFPQIAKTLLENAFEHRQLTLFD